jgi:ABC-type transport system involved in multi-copper enzyme maturation permease subunit
MKALLWKEYRQNRQVLLAAAALTAIPYVGALLRYLFEESPTYSAGSPLVWAFTFHGISELTMMLTVVAFALIAGNSIAGERADRSTEFTFSLPIARTSAWIGKIMVAVAACTILIAVHACLRVATAPGIANRDYLLLLLSSSVLAFGAAWVFSSLLNNSAVTTVLGISAFLVIYSVIRLYNQYAEPAPLDSMLLLAVLDIAIGLIGFCVGSLIYLRRVEP